ASRRRGISGASGGCTARLLASDDSGAGLPRAGPAEHVPGRSRPPHREALMASAWIAVRPTADGGKRYRVMYRLGGRESAPRYAGSFSTRRDALARKAWVVGELAAMRLPDRRLAADAARPTVAEVAAAWQASRVDVAAGTLETYRVALGRILPRLGQTPAREL